MKTLIVVGAVVALAVIAAALLWVRFLREEELDRKMRELDEADRTPWGV